MEFRKIDSEIGESMEKILKVNGMRCKSCELLLIDVLSDIKEISNISADHEKAVVRFTYSDPAVLILVNKAIDAEGYMVG